MPNGAQNLGLQLGDLLFGQGNDKAYYEGQAAGSLVNSRQASADASMAAARKSRADAMIGEDKLNSRNHYDPTAFLDPNATLEQRAAAMKFAALGDIAANASAAMDTYSKGRSQERIDAAEAALRGGNTLLGNQLAALSQGEPLQTTTVTDGQAYNQYSTPGQDIPLTALGDATAADKRASAAAHNAQSRLYGVQADAGGYSPGRTHAAPSGYRFMADGSLEAIPGGPADDGILSGAEMVDTARTPAHAFGLGGGNTAGPTALPPNSMPVMQSVAPAAATAAAPMRNAPTPGTSEGGYIFKGGDPSNPANWVKMSDLVMP